jgi:serine/threonine-protein kinase PknK
MELRSRYRLLECLGTGTTARVFRAEDPDGSACILKVANAPEHGATLALEAFHAHLASSPRLPMLLGLGRLRLDEPHGLAAIDEGGLPAIAFDFRPGVSLAAQAPYNVPARSSFVGIALGLAEALDDLHRLGLAHGDVKPDNVRIDGDDVGLLDLGSVKPLSSVEVAGATPRYLGLGDASLGDARHRDLLAFGLLLAEWLSADVRGAARPLDVARGLPETDPVSCVALALLASEPSSRPSASWAVRQLVREWPAARPSVERHQRTVRATYLRLRHDELGVASVDDETASWVLPTQHVVLASHALCDSLGLSAPPGLPRRREGILRPLDSERRLRWLTSLVGLPTTTWEPILVGHDERALERALLRLSATCSPHAFTLPLLTAALRGETPTSRAPCFDGPLDAGGLIVLARELAQVPPSAEALDAVERRRAELPTSLIVDAAEALRLRGETTRARHLLAQLDFDHVALAETMRRSGDLDAARLIATRILEGGPEPTGRARALLARLSLDAGDLEGAAEHASSPTTAPELEVAALLAHRCGDAAKAVELATQGRALATNDEQRARLAATLAYTLHPSEPPQTHALYVEAAEHALRAGAILEEATYRTGQAAAAVDRGRIEEALSAARRATLLFEDVLSRSDLAARAWLARAAAYAAIGATREADAAVDEVLRRAGSDARAKRFALFARCDSAPRGSDIAVEAARQAVALASAELLAHVSSESSPSDVSDDDLRALARLVRHAPPLPFSTDRLDVEVLERGALLRLEWWHARSEQLLQDALASPLALRSALDALRALLPLRLPSVAFGRAMHAARELARAHGDEGLAARFEQERRAVAEDILANVPAELVETARATDWLAEPTATHASEAGALRGLDLARLVRTLAERDDLEALLGRVLDVLVEWTGAERGLLLLRRTTGSLVPRASRHLSRRDLGDEQRAISTTLAERALREGQPVVAIDAMSELGDLHASVQALALRSVLVIPLVARGSAVGVVYLDDRVRRGAFGPQEVAWARTVATVAAVAIADARRQRALERAMRRAERAQERLERELSRRQRELEVAQLELSRVVPRRQSRSAYHAIIGESPALERLLALCDRVAATDVPVLIQGESGSGKELIARALHDVGPRSSAPFVSENCGALPETLLESTLFGHVRGAFTGATRSHVGLLEAADGGTLFLDEIGEMSLAMQTKLLRVLEDGVVRPVGSERGRRVDVRLVAATHRDLAKLVHEGRFREDLLYRLDVLRMQVPPLRERRDDIPLLVRHFLRKHGNFPAITVTPEALERLVACEWPGNVRQLENEIRRALVLCDGVIDESHLTVDRKTTLRMTGDLTLKARVDALEGALVEEALQRTNGNQTRAAELLGMSRFGLHKLMKRLGLRR